MNLKFTPDKQIRLWIFLDNITDIINEEILLGNCLWYMTDNNKFSITDKSKAVRENNYIYINTEKYSIVLYNSNEENNFLNSTKSFEKFIEFYLNNRQLYFFGNSPHKKFKDVILQKFKIKNINFK